MNKQAQPSKGGKSPARNTRKKLLKAAIRLFAEKGYHGVSVDRIVSAANVNKRMVYHYFGSKENLYREALVEVYQRLERLEHQVMDKPGDPEKLLKGVIKNYFDFHAKNREFVRLLLWENLNDGRVIRKHGHLLSKHPAEVGLQNIVDEGIKSGVFHDKLNIQHLLINLIGLCFIYHSNRYTLSQALNMDLASEDVQSKGMESAIDLVLNGIRKR